MIDRFDCFRSSCTIPHKMAIPYSQRSKNQIPSKYVEIASHQQFFDMPLWFTHFPNFRSVRTVNLKCPDVKQKLGNEL